MMTFALFTIGITMWASPIIAPLFDGINPLDDTAYYRWITSISLERITFLEQAVLVGPLLTIAGVALPK